METEMLKAKGSEGQLTSAWRDVGDDYLVEAYKLVADTMEREMAKARGRGGAGEGEGKWDRDE